KEPALDEAETQHTNRCGIGDLGRKSDFSWEANIGQVDADDPLWMGQCRQAHDTAPNVPTGGSKLFVTKPFMHQARQQVSRADRLHPSLPRTIREPEARKTGNDDIKGALWVSTEAFWVGKHGNDLMEAVKRVRPAMNEEQRDGIGSFPTFIEKMNALPIDLAFELRKLIELRIVVKPVVVVLPVVY